MIRHCPHWSDERGPFKRCNRPGMYHRPLEKDCLACPIYRNEVLPRLAEPSNVPSAPVPVEHTPQPAPKPQPQPSPKSRWAKVQAKWAAAQSWLASMKSRGITGQRAPGHIKSLRVLACHGDPAASVAACASRAYGQGKFHFCNDCSCGQREMARLSAVGSAPDKPEFVPDEYDKLDYPHLECPRQRPGFSNGPVPAEDYLDGTWVISLARTPERLVQFNGRFPADWPFAKPQVFPAVDGKATRARSGFAGGTGAWGCLQSHQQIVQRCLDQKINKPVLILEDDAQIVSVSRVMWAMATVPADAEILFLGGQHFRPTMPVVDAEGQVTQGIVRCRETGRTHAYILFPRFFEQFVRFLDIWHTHIDHGLQFWCKYTTEESAAERVKMLEAMRNPATAKALVEGGFLHTKRAFYAADPFAIIQAANKSQISGRMEPNRSWDGRIKVQSRHPSDVPLVILHAPRAVVQGLREKALIHTGYWREPATDMDRGLIEVLAKPEAQRPAALGQWLATLRPEAAAFTHAALGFWYPGLSESDLAVVRKALGQPREITAATVDDAVRLLAGSDTGNAAPLPPKTRAVVTMNLFKENLRPNARASMQDAARRWDADFVEIKAPQFTESRNAFDHKLWLDHYCRAYQRVVFLDADVVVRSDCPSLFDLVPATHFGGARTVYDGDPNRAVIHEHLGPICQANGIALDYEHEYLNSGVLVFSPVRHAGVFEKARALASATSDRHWTLIDQGVLSVAAKMLSPQTMLEETFNRCGVLLNRHFDPAMNHYVYHFCGIADRDAKIDQTQWNVPVRPAPLTLVLTAAVKVGTYPIAVNDPAVRLAEYRAALRRWLTESPFTHLVIAEASGTPILEDPLRKLAIAQGKVLTEVVLDLSAVAKQHGKGRPEAMLTDAVVPTLPEGPFYKVTGRLFVENASQIALGTTDRVVFTEPGINHTHRIDTRFWKATKEYYLRNLLPLTGRISDSRRESFIENVYPPTGAFAVRPVYCGRSGHDGRPYDRPLEVRHAAA